jgi:putative membrane protein
MPAIVNYILHLVLASAMLVAFFKIYSGVTPFDEVLLIRQGNCAALLSFAGALLGFVLITGNLRPGPSARCWCR